MPQNIRIPEWNWENKILQEVDMLLFEYKNQDDESRKANVLEAVLDLLSSLATEMMVGVGEDYQEDTPIDKGMNLEKHIIADRLKKVAERWGIDLTNK